VAAEHEVTDARGAGGAGTGQPRFGVAGL